MAKELPIRWLLIVTGSTSGRRDGPSARVLSQTADRGFSGAGRHERPAGSRRLSRSNRGRLSLDPRRATPEPADNLARWSRSQRTLAPLAGGGSRLAGLQRTVLHSDGPRPGRAPRQHLGHGQRHHSDSGFRLC